MIECYDTVDEHFQGGVPADAQAILFYVDGLYANEAGARARFPGLFAAGRAVGLTVRGRVAPGDDFEPGNWRGDAGAWVHAGIAAGIWRPIIYADGSDFDNLVFPSLEAVFGRPLAPPGPGRRFRTILADPDGVPTIPSDHDGKQYWWGSIQGHGSVDLDKTVLRYDFFRTAAPPPQPPTPEETEMIVAYRTADNRIGLAVEKDDGEVKHIEQQDPSGKPGGNADWWRDEKTHEPNWLSLGKP